MGKSLPLIAIVGRPNVGKSTLFNLLSNKPSALVADHPGITRDRNYIIVNHHNRPFSLVDTGGLLGESDPELANQVEEQTDLAIFESDLIIAMFDGKNGPHPLDEKLVDKLRRSKKPIIWLVNKCEKEQEQLSANEFYQLGIDELHNISAAHNLGIKDLLKSIWERLDLREETTEEQSDDTDVIKIAILGKPNAGKSTLVNKLIGEQRLITSPIAGTTRDNLIINLKREDQEYQLIDTAGLRKQKNIKEKTFEQVYSFRSLRAIALSDVVLMLIDGSLGAPSDQDAKIAEQIHKRGKGMVLVINKWDAVEKDHRTAKEFEKEVRDKLPFCSYAPILFVSALSGRRCPSIFEEVKKVYQSGQFRIATSELNKILENAVTKNQPPKYRGQVIKFYFATQVEYNPPTFVLFFNHPKRISQAYERYLKNYIRAQHPYIGYDIKIICRKKTGSKRN